LLKKLYLFFIFWTFFSQPVLAQNNSRTLAKADSLFEAGAYEQAYPLYRQVLRQEQLVSNRLLLRMAYIQEGLEHYPAALYYLSLAQARQPRAATWRKMTELAQNYRLTGYTNTWQQQLLITIRRYYYRVLQALLVGAVVGGTLLLVRHHQTGTGWWAVYAGYIGLTVVYLNMFGPEKVGIVSQSTAALMAAPSPGATWLTTAAAGDRLVVVGQRDIWYEVQWRGQPAYIRRHDLMLVQ
jgi:tetratricopeptide (TPR) repeat protein